MSMSLLERIDESLLHRFDTFVAWNLERGRADQWHLAAAAFDIGLGLLVAGFIVDLALSYQMMPWRQAFYIILLFIFGFAWSKERRSVHILSRREDGARRARIVETQKRQNGIIAMTIVGAIIMNSMAIADSTLFVTALIFEMGLYLKAAEPPPPILPEAVELMT